MRKLLSIFLLFVIAGASAQTTDVVIGPYAGFGRLAAEINATNNIRIPLKYYIPASALPYLPGGAKAGQRPPHLYMFNIDLHGCDKRTTTFANFAAVTTAELGKLFSNHMAQYVQTSTSDYVNKKFAAPGKTDSFEVIYAFPQAFGGTNANSCSVPYSGLGLFEPAYVWYTYQWMVQQFGNLIDKKHCYLTGLSFGAGGVWIAAQMLQVRKLFAGFRIAAPGYIDLRNIASGNTAPGVGSNWAALDSFPGIIVMVHSTDDTQTDKKPGTSIGCWYSDVARDSLLKRKSVATVVFVRKTNGDHSGSWNSWQDPDNKSVAYPMSNGQSWIFNYPWQGFMLSYSLQTE